MSINIRQILSNLVCTLGVHWPYRDHEFFNSVQRCSYCDWVSNKTDAANLDAEREAWDQVTAEGITDFGQRLTRVMEILDFETDAL